MLNTHIKYLKGVGPLRAELLQKELHISTFRDLLFHVPFKYIDRSEILTVAQLCDGMPHVVLRGELTHIVAEGEGRRRRMKAVFFDGTGYCELVWFNATKALENQLRYNTTYQLFGKPTFWNGRPQFAHPELETIASEGTSHTPLPIQAHYHTTEAMKRSGLTSRTMSKLVAHVFEKLGATPIPETLSQEIIATHGLLPLGTALRQLHFPQNAQEVSAATKRLKFEELFFLNLQILSTRAQRRTEQSGFLFPRVGEYFHTFYRDVLPFPLTEAQKRVLREIRADMRTGKQMNRLLQGDVGSGKTMVALMASLLALDNGFQACIMAPTEILAEQHAASLQQMLGPLGIHVCLLTGIVKGRARREALQGVADGSIQILIGTHALIEPTVQFHNLGLAVIDEQHRFGVKQRAALWEKNTLPPHVLVMTATPIPRTLAMTVYGDLDVSVLDELPPGRKPITTIHYHAQDRANLYSGIRRELAAGRQIYFVYPLIEESETQDLADLETNYLRLCEVFAEYRVGKVHGRMPAKEKDAVMRQFLRHEIHILVSTTVIEVGVNVPNASVMVIENAERFGLAQLHQLRGRVGRGTEKSYCILMTKDRLVEASQQRMEILCESTDGFRIAEEDLRLRGPGSLEGTQQSGLPFTLHVASLLRDTEEVEITRKAAQHLLETDASRSVPANRPIWQQLDTMKKQADYSEIS